MTYKPMIEGRFIQRLNRFIAEVEVEGVKHLVHVKNTGRCQELFIKGVKVFLEPTDNPSRKTKYSLISLYKGQQLINIDSQVPNRVVYDALMHNQIEEIQDVQYLKREVTYGTSRFDLYYETKTRKGFIEVKGVTLEVKGLALFPDAPTERGSKHLLELTKGLDEGYDNYVLFLIQMNGIYQFRPHHERDPKLAELLYYGQRSGLGVLVYNSIVTEQGIELNQSCQLLPQS